MASSLFIVFLRRPRKDDGRTDPYWEFGSFGCTGCHGKNLLNPEREHVKTGDRLAFVQGGDQGCKLLLITPPVQRVQHANARMELRWNRAAQPFRYNSKCAPVLAHPGVAETDLVELGKMMNAADRTTAQAKLASCFRSRCQAIDPKPAAELTVLFDKARQTAKPSQDFIQSYTDALPWRISAPLSLQARKREYQNLTSRLALESKRPCCPPKAKVCKT
jgi:hypothetical protein